MKYKLRAEFLSDVLKFMKRKKINIDSYMITNHPGYPDVDFVFETQSTLEEIIKELRYITDGHVMYQTVKPFSEYTGHRNYDL